ncbi:hypothetical protein JCM5350_005573 [Sporobolomyces pararoseus]
MTSSPSFPSLSPLETALPDTQLAPPPPPFAPFSRLPYELVEAIVHSTVPRCYSYYEAYMERQRTLRSVSLVCRAFHEIAKPLLFAVALIEDDLDAPWWKEWQEEDPSSPCLELIVKEVDWPNENKLPPVKPLIQAHLQLKVLVLDVNEEEICLADLSCLVNLSILQLVSTSLIGDRPFIFPKLSQLSIDELGPVNWVPWGDDRARFPSLRVLNSYWLHYSHHPLLEHLIGMLSDQLELLNVQQRAIARISSTSFDRIKHKTVFWVDGDEEFTLQSVRYLRLGISGDVETFTSQLFKSPIGSLPSVLYLPAFINPDNPWTSRDFPQIASASRVLLDKCQQHNVHVVFEDNDDVLGALDPPFSADFYRRMEKERLEKEGLAK